LIIHPGSRNLRVGRASDFYPKEIPNCVARPAKAVPANCEASAPGGRRATNGNGNEERVNKRAKLDTDIDMDGTNGGDEAQEHDPVSLRRLYPATLPVLMAARREDWLSERLPT
jgi:actin-related protein 8